MSDDLVEIRVVIEHDAEPRELVVVAPVGATVTVSVSQGAAGPERVYVGRVQRDRNGAWIINTK